MAPAFDPVRITGVILAGGRGVRMGGRNKGLLPLRGKPLVSHAFGNIASQVDKVIISANQDLQAYGALGVCVCPDGHGWRGSGPLAGIASVAEAGFLVDADVMVVVPCDTPFLPHDLVERLVCALFAQEGCEVVYASTPDRMHPSVFACRTSINEDLPSHINAGHHSLRSWILRHNHQEVVFYDEEAFANINCPESLEHYQR